MNGQARTAFSATMSRFFGPCVSALALLALGACSSENGVSLGDGQQADPVVIDFPIAYVRAPQPLDDDGELVQSDVREPIDFNFGADLYFRDRASVSTEAVNITGELTQGLYAIKDVEIAYDGSAILFAMRGPVNENLDLDDEDQPTWNIWEYVLEDDNLRRVIASDLTAGIGHDMSPHYLPDDRIIFTSTRQIRSKAILLDEGKPQYEAQDEDDNGPALVLHVMNRDGTGIEQVSYNQSHDLDPSVLSNGQVVFSRWDNAPLNNTVNLYRMNPDGSSLEILYGKESHATGTNGSIIQFMQPRELEDGRIMALARPFTDTSGGGNLIVIDTQTYVENTQPTAANAGLTGPAQLAATINNVSTEPDEPSPGGRYASVYPIQDGTGRLLVSWSQCRLTDIPDPMADPMNPPPAVYYPCTAENLINPLYVEAAPIYGVWMYDPRDNTQAPVVPPEDGFVFTEVVSADPRPIPPVILDSSNNFPEDPNLANEDVGVIHIRSVYDFDGGAVADIDALADPSVTMADARPARFLRVVKPVSMPDEDTLDFDNNGIRCESGKRDAGDPWLRANRAGRLGHGQSSGQRRVWTQCARRERTPHHGTSQQLDAGATRRTARVQRLSPSRQRSYTRSRRSLRFCLGWCANRRRLLLSEHRRCAARRRYWRHHGRGSRAVYVQPGAELVCIDRTVREPRIRRRLDGPGQVRPSPG